MFSKKTVTLFLTGFIVSGVNGNVCTPKSGSCDECTVNLVSSATNSDGTLFCSDQQIETTDRGVKFPDGNVVFYINLANAYCDSPCFDDDSEDSPDTPDDDQDDGDEEGDDVCIATDAKSDKASVDDCCPDSRTVIKGKVDDSGGDTYCVKYWATEVDKGIKYTYPDGKNNTKFWRNIYPCEPNSRGFCHYDESEDGPLDQVVPTTISEGVNDDGGKTDTDIDSAETSQEATEMTVDSAETSQEATEMTEVEEDQSEEEDSATTLPIVVAATATVIGTVVASYF